MALDIADGQIQGIRSIVNPDKLGHLGPVADLRALLAEPQLPPENLLHDLVGPAADRAEAQVARHALDLVLLHVAGAAVDLERLVGNLEGRALADSLASVTSRMASVPSANRRSAW